MYGGENVKTLIPPKFPRPLRVPRGNSRYSDTLNLIPFNKNYQSHPLDRNHNSELIVLTVSCKADKWIIQLGGRVTVTDCRHNG